MGPANQGDCCVFFGQASLVSYMHPCIFFSYNPSRICHVICGMSHGWKKQTPSKLNSAQEFICSSCGNNRMVYISLTITRKCSLPVKSCTHLLTLTRYRSGRQCTIYIIHLQIIPSVTSCTHLLTLTRSRSG